jgi:hypothetical protein
MFSTVQGTLNGLPLTSIPRAFAANFSAMRGLERLSPSVLKTGVVLLDTKVSKPVQLSGLSKA